MILTGKDAVGLYEERIEELRERILSLERQRDAAEQNYRDLVAVVLENRGIRRPGPVTLPPEMLPLGPVPASWSDTQRRLEELEREEQRKVAQ